MFSTTQIAAFALSILSVSLGRPLGSETPIRRVGQHVAVRAHVVRPQVVPQVVRAKVVARDAPATCSSCAATLTFTVSGTATATAAFTFTAGFPASTASVSGIGNFGSCPIPQVEFGAGFDGRLETSFRPVDQASYNHTSADTIGVIADFICSALVNTCHADSTAQATCAKAQAAAAAAAQPPQEGIDADAFNAVFGIQTNFKDVAAVSSVGITSSTSTSSTSVEAQPTSSTATVASTDTTELTTSTTPSAATSTGDATITSSSPAAPISSTAAAATPLPTNTLNSGSSNLQPFTGSLGGIAPPTVVVSGLQFQVVGNSLFKTKGDALARSCSIQKNDCADAANASGDKGSFTVAACNIQQSACIAAGGT